MKALSIKQPWAYLIVHGYKNFHSKEPLKQRYKTIENRTWNTKYRGRFLVHASKQIDKRAMKHFSDLGYVNPDDCVTGAIIGSVDLVNVIELSSDTWFQGPYGFVLENPKWFLSPKKMKGKLKFFEVDL